MKEKQIIETLEHRKIMIELGEEPLISIETITEILNLIQSKNAKIERLREELASCIRALGCVYGTEELE